jgi:hypothetical protein
MWAPLMPPQMPQQMPQQMPPQMPPQMLQQMPPQMLQQMPPQIPPGAFGYCPTPWECWPLQPQAQPMGRHPNIGEHAPTADGQVQICPPFTAASPLAASPYPCLMDRTADQTLGVETS